MAKLKAKHLYGYNTDLIAVNRKSLHGHKHLGPMLQFLLFYCEMESMIETADEIFTTPKCCRRHILN